VFFTMAGLIEQLSDAHSSATSATMLQIIAPHVLNLMGYAGVGA